MGNPIQPKTSSSLDSKSLERIKKTIKNMRDASMGKAMDPGYASKLPTEIGLQLTKRCNLRCKHCFQWNDDGFFNKLDKISQNSELNINTVEKILRQTQEVKSNLYLWGGEPLYYNHWDYLCDLLEKDPRETVICTNGILIEERIESILKISKNTVLLISLEGFEEENDSIRGKSTFKKVLKNLELLLELKKKGDYKGKLSVECVVNDSMADKLYDFVEFLETKGLDAFYICFPWYISDETAREMDCYFKQNFGFLDQVEENNFSWYSYKYKFDSTISDNLYREMEKINSRSWNTIVRYQPPLKPYEVHSYISGEEIPAQEKCKSKCLSLAYRMDVLADGKVSSCKLFPEFTVGDLNNEDVYDVWHSSKFRTVREMLDKGLMPVCSRCVLLYLHGQHSR